MYISDDKVKFLTKEELKGSRCCRFCGHGARVEVDRAENFIPIYETVKAEEPSETTLDMLINKYLPIKVSEKELYYPQVICSDCHSSLLLTIEFFQKIVQGQKILARIINEVNLSNSSATVVKTTEEECINFSQENPVLAAPKRRGRPRRDPTKPKAQPPPLPTEYFELKPKRHCRPPARYDPTDSGTVSEVVVKQEVEDAPPETENDSSEFLSQLGLQSNEPVSNNNNAHSKNDTGNLLNMASEFTSLTNSQSLMDLSRLSVIMDGDEEVDSQAQVNMELLQDKTTATQDFPSPHVIITPENPPSEKTSGANPETEDSIIRLEGLQKTDDGNESDASVKTIDFVIAKPKGPRGRRKIKRKLKKRFHCEECSKEFSHTSSLAYHRNSVHAEEKKFVCDICGKGFTHKQLLVNHTYVHSDEKVFKCPLCPAKFKSRASLYTHNKSIHTSKNVFNCPQCESKFNLKSSLKAHLRLHTGEKPFSCEFCHKKFAQRSNYSEHRRIHTGERPYKCEVIKCGKAFTTASQLRSHKMTHSGAKQFLCSVCGRGFTHAENFKYHMRRHNGEKPVECPLCMKLFTDPGSLNKHWREKHAEEKQYTCETCNKAFPDALSLANHKKTHEEEVPPIPQNQVSSIPEEVNALTSEVEIETETSPDVPPQVIEAAEQVVEGVADYAGNGYVHILNAENVTALDGAQEGQQVIYLYPEDLSYYTITLADNHESLEVRPNEEALQGLGGSIAFAAVDAEIAAQYFNLEQVAGATITVPAMTGSEELGSTGTVPEMTGNFIESNSNKTAESEGVATTDEQG